MIDLHLHLDGSIDPEDMPRLAELSGAALPSTRQEELRSLLSVEPDCRNLGEYLEKFQLPLRVLQTGESLEYAVYRLLERLSGQGLCHGEIRFAPQLHLEKGMTQEQAVSAAAAGLLRGIRDFGLSAGLILCCMRGEGNRAENMETVAVAERFLGRGVCALDLAGNEAAYPTDRFADVFRRAGERGIPVVIHAGEAAGAESVRTALELGAVRIGHGIHAASDAELMEILRDRGIFLELCYSSNLQTRAVGLPEEYPLERFLDRGIRVTVNTDNVTVSGTSLKREYLLLQERFGLSGEALKGLAINAAEAAFVTEGQRAALKERIDREFPLWLSAGEPKGK